MRMEGVTLAVKLCKLIFPLFFFAKIPELESRLFVWNTHISNAKQDEIPEFQIVQCSQCPNSSQLSIRLHTNKSMLLRIKYKTFERPPLNRFGCTQRTRTIVVLVLCTALTFRCILFDFGWKNEFFSLSFAKECLSGWQFGLKMGNVKNVLRAI